MGTRFHEAEAIMAVATELGFPCRRDPQGRGKHPRIVIETPRGDVAVTYSSTSHEGGPSIKAAQARARRALRARGIEA